MLIEDYKKIDLPDSPGVYFFYGPKKPARTAETVQSGGQILYIGKATSLKDRVKSYFSKDLMKTRGPLLVKMLEEAEKVEYMSTDSVLEALMLEAAQIKKHTPYYNTKEKDNKSFNMVVITDEDFPQVLVMRARNYAHWDKIAEGIKCRSAFGPFPHGGELREALKIMRRIFPYRDEKCAGPNAKRPCFNYQIGLCPGPCANAISKREYRKTIKHLELFFQGKKDTLVKELEEEMKVLAKEEKFEEAQKLKRTIYALEHIQDVGLIKRDLERVESEDTFRIEAYDIAHISGSSTVGVMVVVEDGELNKSQYRKFRIRGVKGKVMVDDPKNLKEVLVRRLGHAEWMLPKLIVLDGGVAQINAAKEVLAERGFNIDIASVVKDNRHKAREILAEKRFIETHGKSIILANSEAHRFAIGYHRKLRNKGFRI